MKKVVIAALAAASMLALSACNQAAAADPIEGNWKAELSSAQFEDEPDVYLLKDGSYSCPSCNPPLTVAADGQFHPVADRPYYDSMSVTAADEHTLKFERKKGDRSVGSSTMSVSHDGNTLTVDFVDSSVPDSPPVTGKGTATRVAAAPEGSHAVSGSWKQKPLESLSDEGLTFSYDVEGDTVKSKAGDGTTYEAKVGGPEVPVQGDQSGLVVSVARPSPNSLVETFKRDGKVVGIGTMTAGEDGKLSGTYENKVSGSKTSYTASKTS